MFTCRGERHDFGTALLTGPHEHKPSRLAPPEEKARIGEENKKLEAKRAAEEAERTAKEAAEKAAKEAAQASAELEKKSPTAPSKSISVGTTLQVSTALHSYSPQFGFMQTLTLPDPPFPPPPPPKHTHTPAFLLPLKPCELQSESCSALLLSLP
jgi:hypothetical protein